MSCGSESANAVDPSVYVMSSQETLPLTFDVSAALLPGEAVLSASAQVWQVDNGLERPASRPGNVAIAGALLTQTVTGLLPRKRYRLVIQYSVAANKTWAPYLLIDCPE